MSRATLNLDEQRQLVFGYDRPFRTYYLQLWNRQFDPDWVDGRPEKAAGYHPIEQGIPPFAGEYGPYPLNIIQVDGVLQEWGIAGEFREDVGRTLAKLDTREGRHGLASND